MDRKEVIAQLVEYGFERGYRELDEMVAFVRRSDTNATEDEVIQAVAESIPGLVRDRRATLQHEAPLRRHVWYWLKRRARWYHVVAILGWVFWTVGITAYVTAALWETWK